MSLPLDPLNFPLHGARLIEASAGTGKTWTIAALYLRLVLGHGGDAAFARPLIPSEILVMTFTRAATRELTERIRARLVDAAACFRGRAPDPRDNFLLALLADCQDPDARLQAAHRLAMAAEAMDECAIFTIDAWCQRMLREHAFDSGSLFEEELIASEQALFRDAVRDYWREQVYPLDAAGLAHALDCWNTPAALEQSMRDLLNQRAHFDAPAGETLARLIARVSGAQQQAAAALKPGWLERVERMEQWYEANRASLNGNTLRAASVAGWLGALRGWAGERAQVVPAGDFDKACDKLAPDNLRAAVKKGCAITVPDDFLALAGLQQALAGLEPLRHHILRHAAVEIGRRIAELKQRAGQIGFADMLARLRGALESEHGVALAQRITARYPVALIDEFQDTSPDQYRIFDSLYDIAANRPATGLFLIGDPKQAIYSFRGADIRSYLTARRATEGRHYLLTTNFRSTAPLVDAVNRIFLHAEGDGVEPGHPAGAFRFRNAHGNALPFEAVGANGRAEVLQVGAAPAPALTFWCGADPELGSEPCRHLFAARCAEQIVTLLNDAGTGFQGAERFERLRPADIAVLVRDFREAGAVRAALQQRGVASVYLSDKDSVFKSREAADVLLWLQAVAAPLDGTGARAAFATPSAGLSLATLAQLAADDLAWEVRVEQLKALRQIWQRQGVLAMLRHFIHELGLPARLLGETGGERSLTDLLHLSELLQGAAQQLDGEQALIRWLAEQIADDSGGDERILRLESDAELVQVITVHKSKGLEYPLVFLPFAAAARPVTRRNREFFAYAGSDGANHVDFALTDQARDAVNTARIDEDVRLLYVALTRARHALWLGVAAPDGKLHESALGYLLGGGTQLDPAALEQVLATLADSCAAIHIAPLTEAPARTRLQWRDERPALVETPRFSRPIERNWRIASYTSISSELGAMALPAGQLAEKLLEAADQAAPGKRQEQPWHRFPRGALAGQFLHEQLEWMAHEGFDASAGPSFEARLAQRCERAGWGLHAPDLLAWLGAATHTPLPPLDAPLAALAAPVPEMEFWLPAAGVATAELDRLCRRHVLPDLARPALSERQLHGMLRGFMDLVFEHEGRYWVLDYKSNALANDDAGYDGAALGAGMMAGRYDVQGVIYLQALHRLLRSRLGAAYDPARQLGGAIFFFLRGLAHPVTHGCHWLAPEPGLLAALERLLPHDSEEAA